MEIANRQVQPRSVIFLSMLSLNRTAQKVFFCSAESFLYRHPNIGRSRGANKLSITLSPQPGMSPGTCYHGVSFQLKPMDSFGTCGENQMK